MFGLGTDFIRRCPYTTKLLQLMCGALVAGGVAFTCFVLPFRNGFSYK